MRHTALVAVSFVSLVKNKMLNIVDFIKSLFVKRFSMINFTKAVAFTLAETLVVMGIIGVVAALTIPNLNQSTGDREKVAKLKKVYSNLNDANSRATAIHGPINEWYNAPTCQAFSDGLQDCWVDRISEFLKVSKRISFDHLILADGTELQVTGSDSSCSSNGGIGGLLSDICVTEVDVDIDGPNKGKNEYGIDIFKFAVSDSNGVLPWWDDTDDYETQVGFCLEYKDDRCTFWVLEHGNMDYLKSDEEGKCNDSNVVLDGIKYTSCK